MECPRVSLQQVAEASFPRDEALYIAAMLAFTGGYLEAYAWIVHRVFANAQSANLVFLWVYVTSGEWGKALHYMPPLLAFTVGVIMACWLRWAAPLRSADQPSDRDRIPVRCRDPAQSASWCRRHARHFAGRSVPDGEFSAGRGMELQLGDGDQ
jgi:hypothetical protein